MTILMPMVVIETNHIRSLVPSSPLNVIIQADVCTYLELASLCHHRFTVMVFLIFHFHMLAGVPWAVARGCPKMSRREGSSPLFFWLFWGVRACGISNSLEWKWGSPRLKKRCAVACGAERCIFCTCVVICKQIYNGSWFNEECKLILDFVNRFQ